MLPPLVVPSAADRLASLRKLFQKIQIVTAGRLLIGCNSTDELLQVQWNCKPSYPSTQAMAASRHHSNGFSTPLSRARSNAPVHVCRAHGSHPHCMQPHAP